MTERALVIGGTGPTGPFVVNGLRARGLAVTIFHTGRHEIDEIPADVAHLHGDPFDEASTAAVIGDATFDLAIVMYGRLRILAPFLAGRVGRIVTIGGVGATRGWVEPDDLFPSSLTVPGPPDAALAPPDEPIRKIRRIVETEDAVFEHHPLAIHLRYPMLYGPRQLIPREWPIVRRAIDRRPFLVVADGGLTLKSASYVENAAEAVLCAVDAGLADPQAASGRHNVADEWALTLRQMAEVIADEVGHRFEIVSMPPDLAVPARPLVMHHSTGHRVVNTESLRVRLGYRDVVEPEEGLRRTVRWLIDNPPSATTEALLQDPFDYGAEDALVHRWRSQLATFELPSFASEPGYGAAYYGRAPNPATGTSRAETPATPATPETPEPAGAGMGEEGDPA